jgi:uncharacterized protein YuzE
MADGDNRDSFLLMVLDYDKGGNVVGIEILEASKRMGDPMSVEYAIAR